MAQSSSSYDDVPYESYAYPQTATGRLAVLAHLFSLTPVLPSRARVLEIGCAAGGNLIPLAARYPDSTCVGIDLSRRQIEDGRKDIAAMGLTNIELQEKNLMDVDASFGTFDYIIAHGVYSWIPAPARAKLLAICKANLSENGIAYVSYNTLPGWRMRGAIRDMMRFHAMGVADPKQRAGQARALISFLQTSQVQQSSAFAVMLKEEWEMVSKFSDNYLLHDHMEEENEPVYFYEFQRQAAMAGLGYLCDEEFARSIPELSFSPEVAATIRRISHDLLGIEQYTDFLLNRVFRQSLLVRSGQTLNRTIDSKVLPGYFIAANAHPVNPQADIASGLPEQYKTLFGLEMRVPNTIAKAAFAVLAKCWPEALPFEELYQRACALLGRDPKDRADAKLLAEDLLRTIAGRVVAVFLEPPPVKHALAERPLAFAPARHCATQGNKLVPNLVHETIRVDDFTACLLSLLDGTRDEKAMIEGMVDLVAQKKLQVQENNAVVTDPARMRVMFAESMPPVLQSLNDRYFLVA
jgi:methyltransferase-like protein/SAM-dependent methyltransferase